MGKQSNTAFRSVIMLLAYVSSITLALMMFLIMADVLLRYIFNRAIIGAYEIIEYMMAIITSFSVVFTAFEKRHISVDFFFDILPNKAQLLISCLISFILVLFLVLFSWQNVLFTLEIYNQQLTSATLYIPTYPFVAAVALSFLGTCIVLFVEFLTYISQWWKNES